MTESAQDVGDFLTGGALLSLSVAAIASAVARVATALPPLCSFTPMPLPFDSKTTAGHSERLLVSHHENNHDGAVKRLGAIATQFAAIDPAMAPGFQINGLKRKALLARNSMILHELHSIDLGAPSWPGEPVAAATERESCSDSRFRVEHAYALDFGGKAAEYVDACMETVKRAKADAMFAQAAA